MAEKRATRLMGEGKLLQRDPVEGCTVTREGEAIDVFLVTIHGPAGSPYEGLELPVRIVAGPEYPFVKPDVHFLKVPWHPRVASTGVPCVDVLLDWRAGDKIGKLIRSLIDILKDPASNGHVLNESADAEFVSNRELFLENAKVLREPTAEKA
jgi:ubiquitin-conjugating enzyme E2 N